METFSVLLFKAKLIRLIISIQVDLCPGGWGQPGEEARCVLVSLPAALLRVSAHPLLGRAQAQALPGRGKKEQRGPGS